MCIAFFVLWLIFSGRITLEIAIIGLVISLALDILVSKLVGFKSKKAAARLLAIFRYLRYFFVLIKEIVVCCVKVIGIIWGNAKELQPQLFYFSPNIKSENKRVLLSNSITLTPGTITVELTEEYLRVHALDKSFIDGIEECEFIHILKGMEDKYSAR